MDSKKQFIRAALDMLGVDRLVLAIHDQSFPSLPHEESGRGSPYTLGGRQFAQFISDLGFNAIQLGPQGQTSRTNPSPYDSSLFSKNELSISLNALVHDPYWKGLLSEGDLSQASASSPSQKQPRDLGSYCHAWSSQMAALQMAFENFHHRREELQDLWLAFSVWAKQQGQWLERDSLFEALTAQYNTDDWRHWSDIDRCLYESGALTTETQTARAAQLRIDRAREIEFFQFCQFVAHTQHQAFRQHAAELGLKLYADLQIGFSQRDMWALRHLLLPNYLLGAPPSRTNPAGQPWGYPVLNPDLYFETDASGAQLNGPATQMVTSRIDKLLQDVDGVRIDHPHGIVCPWVYKADESDALRAVQQGARLFESPNVEEHPTLAKHSLVTPDDLNSHIPRYGDAWVAKLTDEQIEKYAVLVQLIKDRLHAAGFDAANLICEVLSSCPFPLKSVLQKHKLGRFRVTQKAQPHSSRDVYRSNNAQPEDWIMVSTHDTKSIWRVVDEWTDGERESWAEYLAERIETDDETKREALTKALAADPKKLTEAMFADLFIGPARNVSVFFCDLLGMKEIYNRPGVTSDENWVLSVPNDYAQWYGERAASGEALNLPRALAVALRARFKDRADALELAQKLEHYERVEASS